VSGRTTWGSANVLDQGWILLDVADREVDERLSRGADHARCHGGVGGDRGGHADSHALNPAEAIVALPPRLPIVTTGHCWRSLLNERSVTLLLLVAVVELCWIASQYSPAPSEVLNGTLRNLGPVATSSSCRPRWWC
jgi:hypothetical protein